MLNTQQNLENILPYRPPSWSDEDTTEYLLYLKKKYADNKEFVDFYDEVLADPEYVDKISHYLRWLLKYREEHYNRALLAKTGTTVETDVEENKNIGSNILAISKRLMRFVRLLICALFYYVIMMSLGLILGWLWDLGVFIVLLIVIGLMIVGVKLYNEMLK